MKEQYLLILNTCPDKETATRVANTLVNQRLAACVNILPGLTSVYHWQGQIEASEEHLLLIKSTQEAYDRVESAIRQAHPYELPEVIAVTLVAGLDSYLAWIGDNVATGTQIGNS
jgi:periplasmic divalent cation tolerance protein